METERWIPVVGYEGIYEVSDHGRVRSLDREVWGRNRHGAFSYTLSGRVMRSRPSRDGRLQLVLRKDGKGTTKSVHRLVLEAFEGLCPPGEQCCHWDDDPLNNHLSNLRWGTQSENELDKTRNGKSHNANKTRCPQGHKYTPENTYWSKDGRRRKCRVCVKKRTREYKRRSHG